MSEDLSEKKGFKKLKTASLGELDDLAASNWVVLVRR